MYVDSTTANPAGHDGGGSRRSSGRVACADAPCTSGWTLGARVSARALVSRSGASAAASPKVSTLLASRHRAKTPLKRQNALRWRYTPLSRRTPPQRRWRDTRAVAPRGRSVFEESLRSDGR